MNVKIKKKHADAQIPCYAKNGDAGLDLIAVSLDISKEGILTYDTGLAFEIPIGYFGLVALRSSNFKKDLELTNHVGIIDSSYRGSVSFKFALTQNLVDFAYQNKDFELRIKKGEALYFPSEYNMHWDIPHVADVYKVGDRVGQLIIMPYPLIEFEEVSELSVTERGCGGYGSTGQ